MCGVPKPTTMASFGMAGLSWELAKRKVSRSATISHSLAGKKPNFAETLYKAPEFDGHTSADVLERLKTL